MSRSFPQSFKGDESPSPTSARVPVFAGGGTSGAAAGQARSGVGRRQHLAVALLVIATAQLMVTLDRTIVNIALPSIQHSLHFSVTGLSWVVDAYVDLAAGRGIFLEGGV